MTVFPVIGRELQVAARHSFTYSLRVIGVSVLIAVCAIVGLDQGGANFGPRLFAYLHNALFLAIWVLVPLLTADCVSRERREGTLPLLFLTPLRPADIVIAKGTVHGARALTLWLAVLPVLTIPFLFGGVGRTEAYFSIIVNFSSICLALAAGLVASSTSRAWVRCLAAAECWAFVLGMGFLCVAGLALFAVSRICFPGTGMALPDIGNVLGMGFFFAVNTQQCWSEFAGRIPGRSWMAYLLMAGIAVWSLLMFVLLVVFAAARVRRVWREEPPSARVQWLQKALCTPVLLQSFFRQWLRWELQRNPIGWLERRTWTGRLVVWSWLAVLTTVYSSMVLNSSLYSRSFNSLQGFVAWFLIGSIASSAAGSFRRERETGVLELLLVAPLREWQIISGRIRGLWGQFMPAMVLFCGVWVYFDIFLERGSVYSLLFSWVAAYLAVPVIGLYYSLAKTSFLVAFLWTLLTGMLLPITLAQAGHLIDAIQFYFFDRPFSRMNPTSLWAPGIAAFIHLALGAFFAWRLHSNLKRRRFALETKST